MHWAWNLVIPYWTQKCLWIDERKHCKAKLEKSEKAFIICVIYGKGHRHTPFLRKYQIISQSKQRHSRWTMIWNTVPSSSCPLAFVLRAEGRTDLCRLKECFTNRRWIRSSNIEQYTIRDKKYHGSKGKDWLTVKLFTKSLHLQTSSLQYNS
jgi:hypothetical protein